MRFAGVNTSGTPPTFWTRSTPGSHNWQADPANTCSVVSASRVLDAAGKLVARHFGPVKGGELEGSYSALSTITFRAELAYEAVWRLAEDRVYAGSRCPRSPQTTG